jgi:hypothetical protein
VHHKPRARASGASADIRVAAMPPHWLGTAVTVAGLLVAAWCLVPVLRDRPVDVSHWAALGILQAIVTTEVVVAVVHLARGAHPTQYVTFVGYLVALFAVVPLAVLLARLEPTRWGALIVTVGAVVVPVLVLRVNQLWSGGA